MTYQLFSILCIFHHSPHKLNESQAKIIKQNYDFSHSQWSNSAQTISKMGKSMSLLNVAIILRFPRMESSVP